MRRELGPDPGPDRPAPGASGPRDGTRDNRFARATRAGPRNRNYADSTARAGGASELVRRIALAADSSAPRRG